MEDIRIMLSAIWVALMLVYLLGDVMRIFAGDFSAGEVWCKNDSDYVVGNGWFNASSNHNAIIILDLNIPINSLDKYYCSFRFVDF